MTDTSSLDNLLKQIETKNADRLQAQNAASTETPAQPQPQRISIELTTPDVSATVTPRMQSNSSPREFNDMWDNNLTPRQRALPKLSFQMLGGVVAIMILMVGVGSATLLTQQGQDIRQQASEGDLPGVAGPSAALTQEQYEAQSGQPSQVSDLLTQEELQAGLQGQWSALEYGLVAVAGISIVVLLGFLVWLFAV